jgi:penicillin-binding protein 2
VFSDYEVAVAAKTGTVQTGSDFNDGVFICYAPADNPQIAISVVVEKGGSGAAIMDVAKLIFDEYFRIRATANAVNEGVLIP